MRLSEGVEWAIHCATLLAVIPPDRTLSAARLAEYHGVPAPYLAKHLQSLVRGDVLESGSGPRGGFRLARRPATSRCSTSWRRSTGPSRRSRAPRSAGVVRRGCRRARYTVPCSIHAVMDEADAAWRAELRAVSIADLVRQVVERAPEPALTKGIDWLQEVLA